MAVYPITRQQTLDASQDAATLGKVVNDPAGAPNPGHEDGTVTSRLGAVYYNLATAIAKIAESGGTIGKRTLEQLNADLNWPENTVAFVSNDPAMGNNTFYIKEGEEGLGQWKKADMNYMAPVLAIVSAATGTLVKFINEAYSMGLVSSSVTRDESGLLYGTVITDNSGKVASGVTMDGDVAIGGALVSSRKDSSRAFAVVDERGVQAFGIGDNGECLLGEAEFSTLRSDNAQHVMLVLDDEGQIALGIRPDGSTDIGNVALESSAGALVEGALHITDEDGYAALSITGDGRVIAHAGGFAGEDDASDETGYSYHLCDYNHAISYGQSLSRGAQSKPVVSVVQPYDNTTFLSGVLPRGDEDHDYSGYKALVEENFGAYDETPVSGMANHISALFAKKNKNPKGWSIFGTAPGKGSSSITALVKGTAPWGYMMDQVQAAKDLFNGMGKSYAVIGMSWAQGENNLSGNITGEAYKDALIGMKNDFVADVAAITRQQTPPVLACYQIGSFRLASNPNVGAAIPMAQYNASLEDKGIVLATPMYHIPHRPDNMHLPNTSSEWLGKYYAKAIFFTQTSGKQWLPTHPKRWLWSGSVIDIQYHTPYGALTLDTELVSEAPNYGYDIWRAEEQITDAITSVSVRPGNRVVISLHYTYIPEAGDELRYAFGRTGDPTASGPLTGPRGNLRDQYGDVDFYIDATGVLRRMHNWSVMHIIPCFS